MAMAEDRPRPCDQLPENGVAFQKVAGLKAEPAYARKDGPRGPHDESTQNQRGPRMVVTPVG